jgi:hypothetical protein
MEVLRHLPDNHCQSQELENLGKIKGLAGCYRLRENLR